MNSRRSGIVLLVVLVIIAILSLALYSFADRMLVEQQAARYGTQQTQTRQMVAAGVAAIQVLLVDTPQVIIANGGTYDNPTRLANQTLPGTSISGSGNSELTYVSVIAPRMQATGNLSGTRFGLWDESSKLNLNDFVKRVTNQQQQEEALMGLPGMTLPIAQSILDWIDSDNDPRSSGAESSYYAALPQPYQARNGAIESLEELLLVQGVTPILLFGLDQNRNGVVEAEETNSGLPLPPSTNFGSLELGWAAYLTVWSAENTLSSLGTPKINLNGDIPTLTTSLNAVMDAEWVNFIVAYRMGQPYTGTEPGEALNGRAVDLSGLTSSTSSTAGNTNSPANSTGTQGPTPAAPSGGGGNSGGGASNNSSSGSTRSSGNTANPASSPTVSGPTAGSSPAGSSSTGTNLPTTGASQGRTIGSILDLIGARVQVRLAGQTQPTIIKSPFSSTPGDIGTYMPKLWDAVTTDSQSTVSGRININQASYAVLNAIPGLPDDKITAILGQRVLDPTTTSTTQAVPTWLVSQSVLTLDELKAIFPYINTGGDVYKAQVVAYAAHGVESRAEVIIDATQPIPRVVLWKDMTLLGGHIGATLLQSPGSTPTR